ncbi:MAG: hypothetical protein JXA33_02805, partial [Anaerolineae bacterium]|nr:hypothetical protein [Anaerolineae bacterium]
GHFLEPSKQEFFDRHSPAATFSTDLSTLPARVLSGVVIDVEPEESGGAGERGSRRARESTGVDVRATTPHPLKRASKVPFTFRLDQF